MRALSAGMLTACLLVGLTVGLVSGCNENKAEPVTMAPAPPPPPPSFPESQVPAAEPQPQPQPQPPAAMSHEEEPEAPPPPVDHSAAARRDRNGAARQMPKENYATRSGAKKSQSYTVRRGDTLQKISQKFYGTTKNWRKVYEANRRAIKDPDKLMEGTKLVIP